MKKISGFIAMCLLAPAFALHAGDAPTSAQDRKFVQIATQESLAVQRLGQITTQESENPKVKKVAEKISRDYLQANQQLRDLAKNLNVKVPSDVGRRSWQQINNVQTSSGPEFDQVALQELVTSEQSYLRNIQDEAAKGENPELKQFASTTLPPLQDDIYQVVLLQSDLRTTASASNTR
jgi:putative membrane protein